MKSSRVRLAGLFVLVGTLDIACSSGLPPDKSDAGVGGTVATGGTAGSAAHAGGTANNGGNSAAAGGRGGANGVGGLSSAGGLSVGGAQAKSGSSNAGGSPTGGESAVAGGVTSATGGANPVGGASTIGAAGGATFTGGASYTGGTLSTGGSTSMGTGGALSTVTGGTSGTGGAVSAKLVAKAITAGGDHTCAVLSDGSVQCWGDNSYGELGNGNTTNSSLPVTVPGITNATAVTAGGEDASPSGHSCAVLNSGMIQCWGDNNFGELGDGTAISGAITVPVTVVGITSAIAVASGDGDSNTCALLNGATGINVWCWGSNGDGQLGNGSSGYLTSSSVPELVTGITSAVAVAGSGIYQNLDNHICAVLGNGTVQCWGYNADGELGNGTTVNSSVPVTVPGITSAVAVAAGRINTCAVLSSGTVQCWGHKEDGTTTNSLVPVPVSGITNAIAVAAGGSHACALLSGGSVQCWGLNGAGQLGTGNTTNSWLPVTVYGF